jgi:hypothetical protein
MFEILIGSFLNVCFLYTVINLCKNTILSEMIRRQYLTNQNLYKPILSEIKMPKKLKCIILSVDFL